MCKWPLVIASGLKSGQARDRPTHMGQKVGGQQPARPTSLHRLWCPSFSSSTWMSKLGKALNANNDEQVVHRWT